MGAAACFLELPTLLAPGCLMLGACCVSAEPLAAARRLALPMPLVLVWLWPDARFAPAFAGLAGGCWLLYIAPAEAVVSFAQRLLHTTVHLCLLSYEAWWGLPDARLCLQEATSTSAAGVQGAPHADRPVGLGCRGGR